MRRYLVSFLGRSVSTDERGFVRASLFSWMGACPCSLENARARRPCHSKNDSATIRASGCRLSVTSSPSPTAARATTAGSPSRSIPHGKAKLRHKARDSRLSRKPCLSHCEMWLGIRSHCGSSRTDAGVHAKGQLAHFDTDQLQIPPDGLRRAANARLPDDILIRTIEAVPETFDAISSTLRKRYQYCIWNAEDRTPFAADLAFHRWQPTRSVRYARGGAILVGTHDFASFAKPGHGRENTTRTIPPSTSAAAAT